MTPILITLLRTLSQSSRFWQFFSYDQSLSITGSCPRWVEEKEFFLPYIWLAVSLQKTAPIRASPHGASPVLSVLQANLHGYTSLYAVSYYTLLKFPSRESHLLPAESLGNTLLYCSVAPWATQFWISFLHLEMRRLDVFWSIGAPRTGLSSWALSPCFHQCCFPLTLNTLPNTSAG